MSSWCQPKQHQLRSVGQLLLRETAGPAQNLLRANWTGGNIDWQKSDFQAVLLNPLLAMLSARQLTNQIDYVLLCMDFPYRVADTNGANSTTAALFYGFVPDDAAPGPGLPTSCSLPSGSYSAYAGSEGMFRAIAPGISRTNFLAVMLTSTNLAQAELIVDRGVASDGTFPTQTVYLGKSDDTARNIRYMLFDNAVFNTRLRGNYSMQRTNVNWSNFLGDIAGYQNGYQTGAPTTNFTPGALADQLTSYGGQLYEQSDHTTALQFLNAGAAGSYGTVVEPCQYLRISITAGLLLPVPRLWHGGMLLPGCDQSVSGRAAGRAAGRALRPGPGRLVEQPSRGRSPGRHDQSLAPDSLPPISITPSSKWICSWTALSPGP